MIVAQRQLDREKSVLRVAVQAAIDFLGLHPFAECEYATVVVIQVGCSVDVEELFIGFANHLLKVLAEQLADLAVGILITQLHILDVDVRLNAVEDSVQACFAGLQVAGFLMHLAA